MRDDAPKVVCIGAATLDLRYRLAAPAVRGTSNPGTLERRAGGVARNVAAGLARHHISVRLISVVGDDEAGRSVIAQTSEVDAAEVMVVAGRATGTYVAAIEPDGELFAGFSDLDVCAALDPALIDRRWHWISGAAAVFAETNAPAASLEHLLARCRERGLPLYLDAVSAAKAARLPARLDGVEALFCNLDEARVYLDAAGAAGDRLAAAVHARGAAHAVVTAGAAGLWYAGAEGAARLSAVPVRAGDVTGAGDALIAATIAAHIGGEDLLGSLRRGQDAASRHIRRERE